MHISNICSIFAVRLGIVPRITIKYICHMKGSCVYKVCVNGRVYRIIEENIPHFAGVYFRLYIGRRLYQGTNSFHRYESAIESMKALIDFESRKLEMEGRV